MKHITVNLVRGKLNQKVNRTKQVNRANHITSYNIPSSEQQYLISNYDAGPLSNFLAIMATFLGDNAGSKIGNITASK